jgi:hypothetical protein
VSETSASIRAQLKFDVERLRDAAWRLERVDDALSALRRHLEVRAERLAREPGSPLADPVPASGGGHRYAQALAIGALARRATIREIFSKDSVSLVAAMAAGRWLSTLRALGLAPRGTRLVEAQVEAGRVAYRMLAALRRREGVVPGLGQLVSAVVVAELVHDTDREVITRELEEGVARGRRVTGLDDAKLVRACSRALREGAALLERLARRAEPSVRRLLEEADGIEREAAEALDRAERFGDRGPRDRSRGG